MKQFPPYRDGKPIGFVYHEERHKASYQVVKRGREKRLVHTDDIAEFARRVWEIPDIVWLTRDQIDSLDIPGKHAMRPLNEEEERQVK